MIDPIAPIISELFRAANETERLTKPERARLLHRAAATLRDYRRHINCPYTSANDGGSTDAMREWSVMAQLIELYNAEEVSKALRHAVACLRAARVLAEVRWDIERET
jgi:hypothetical protein